MRRLTVSSGYAAACARRKLSAPSSFSMRRKQWRYLVHCTACPTEPLICMHRLTVSSGYAAACRTRKLSAPAQASHIGRAM